MRRLRLITPGCLLDKQTVDHYAYVQAYVQYDKIVCGLGGK